MDTEKPGRLGDTKNQIDCITINKRFRNATILHCKTYFCAGSGSEYLPVMKPRNKITEIKDQNNTQTTIQQIPGSPTMQIDMRQQI